MAGRSVHYRQVLQIKFFYIKKVRTPNAGNYFIFEFGVK